MGARSVITATLIALTAAAVYATEVEVYGHVYGALTDDFAEGEVGPVTIPESSVEEGRSDDITKDGDPTYNFHLEADVGIRGRFSDDAVANLVFTFDDAKQPKFYRYTLFESESGVYHLHESEEGKYIYASLEEINVELADLAWETDVTLGGYNIRYGNGGYYNKLVNRISPVSFAAHLDPFGARATREFGPAEVSLNVGAGLEHQAMAAASLRFARGGLFVATEGMTYDLKSLWDTHYAASLPKFWRYLYWREESLASEPRATIGTFGETLHVGAEAGWEHPFFELYGVAAYHVYADDEIYEDPTGGALFQVYPDVGIRLYHPRVWFRGAVLYEAWRGNYHSIFGDNINTNDSLLLFGEPQYFFTDNLFVGAGFRYLNPSRQIPDDENTVTRENKTLSIAYIPHLSYAPVENMKIDLTYADTQWDPSYNLHSTDEFEEHRSRELKLEIEAAF
ncbi:MAG: hypothetical protein PVH29_12840 [Candidatus Zixiibacteriota bacterium]|jgi:hypothetical protein